MRSDSALKVVKGGYPTSRHQFQEVAEKAHHRLKSQPASMDLMRLAGTSFKMRNPSGFVRSEPSDLPRERGLSDGVEKQYFRISGYSQPTYAIIGGFR